MKRRALTIRRTRSWNVGEAAEEMGYLRESLEKNEENTISKT